MKQLYKEDQIICKMHKDKITLITPKIMNKTLITVRVTRPISISMY